MVYEIAKIKYERKQKGKDEKLHEDVQNQLIEKLEKRQKELFSKTKSSEKPEQEDSQNKPEDSHNKTGDKR